MKVFDYLFILGLSLGTLPSVEAMESTQPKSLKEFCIQTKADTPKNCSCGQATADRIMSPKEQEMAIALLQEDRKVAKQLGEKHDAFMAKLAKVTRGCANQSTN